MTNPAYSLPGAVSSAVNVNNDMQTTTAGELITDVAAYVPLTIAWSTQLTADEQKYYEDIMGANSKDPTQAAADYAIYVQATAEMSTETGKLSNLIQSLKVAVSFETNHEKQAYNLAGSLTQLTQLYCMLLRLKRG
jgi:hypothetical protein